MKGRSQLGQALRYFQLTMSLIRNPSQFYLESHSLLFPGQGLKLSPLHGSVALIRVLLISNGNEDAQLGERAAKNPSSGLCANYLKV